MSHVHTLQSDSKTHVHTLQWFDKFFKKNCHICVIVVFYNVNTVRSEMWVLVFPHHSCQKLVKSLVFDSWFEKIFWHLWCGKSHTHISSSQYSFITQRSIRPHLSKRGAKRLRCISSKRAARYLTEMQAPHCQSYKIDPPPWQKSLCSYQYLRRNLFMKNELGKIILVIAVSMSP